MGKGSGMKKEMQLEKLKMIQSSGLEKGFGFYSKVYGNAPSFLFLTKIGFKQASDMISFLT